MSLKLRALLLAAAFASSACLRFGYGEWRAGDTPKHDAGSFDGGQAPDANGGTGAADAASGGSGAGGLGAGGRSGSQSSGGTGGSKAGSGGARAGAGGSGASGMVSQGMDAGVDSGTSDAGTMLMEGGTTDSGVAPNSKCLDNPAAVFCDGFEADYSDFKHWEYDAKTNGALDRVTSPPPRSGAYSLRATTTMGSGTQARIGTLALEGQTTGDVWIRLYNFIPGSVAVTQHFSVLFLGEGAAPYNGVELRVLPDSIQIHATQDYSVPGIDFPRGEWVCVELHVKIGTTDGRYDAYINGNLELSSGTADTTLASGYSAAEVGVRYAHPQQGPVEVYVDDVFVGRERIPCD
jgi:hypothetical protein